MGRTELPQLPVDLQIDRVIGEGRTATVYLARERDLDRMVAVKVLELRGALDPTMRRRFEREARAVASIVHPNVVAVYRYGELADERPYVVMQYVRGRSLSDRLALEHRLPEAEARQLFLEVASALSAAHGNGVVHRDVKAANVLFEESSGKFLLTDFGVAGFLEARDRDQALTRAGEILGDLSYVSPELLQGERASEASDVFALGVLIRQALGQAPAQDHSLEQLIVSSTAGDSRSRPTARTIIRSLQSAGPHPAPYAEVPPASNKLNEILKRRVLQFIAPAAAMGWALLQVVDQLSQHRILPAIAYSLALAIVICGLVAVAVVAWFHGERGAQRTTHLEKVLLAIIALACVTILLVLIL